MSNRKTQRKNKTNLVVSWPSNEGYFTIDSLSEMNPDFINITLRVRLKKAISEDNTVAIIGYKNCGKGRPKLALAMRPVRQSVLDKAKADGITLEDDTKLIPVMDIKANKISATPKVPVSTTPKVETTVNA